MPGGRSGPARGRGGVSRRARVAVVASTTALALGGAAAVFFDHRSSGTPAAAAPAATTTVKRETLAKSTTVDGRLGYTDPVPVTSKAGGTVTWLPKVGATIDRGGTLFRADDRPVVLLYGVMPMYRSLGPGAKGPDVAQLEGNLRGLGYTGFTVDDEYTALTAAAVRRWQKKLGLPESGTVEPTWATVAPGAARVAELKVRLGDPAAGEVLSYSGAKPVVIVDVDADAADWADKGVKVQVTLPDGSQAAGTVAAVGAKAVAKDGGAVTLPVTITLTGKDATGRLREAPVEVTYTGERRKNVLTVPVAALLALAEGGYGLEVVDGTTRRYLPVEVGMFTDGRAEVRGAGLAEGMTVGMPA